MEKDIKVGCLSACSSSTGKTRFYVSRVSGENTEYLRSDGKWMSRMDGDGSDWASGGTYFDTRKDANNAMNGVSKAEPDNIIKDLNDLAQCHGLTITFYVDNDKGIEVEFRK